MFIERYANYADMGWISPCTDQTFVVYPQVNTRSRKLGGQ